MDGNQISAHTTEAPGPVVVDVFVAEMDDHVEGVAQEREASARALVRLGMQRQPESSHAIASGVERAVELITSAEAEFPTRVSDVVDRTPRREQIVERLLGEEVQAHRTI